MSHLVEPAKIVEVQQQERDYHNRIYQRLTPFKSATLEFSKDRVWEYLDAPWKQGRSLEGRIFRRFFALLELEQIAGKRVLDIGCGNGQFSVFFAMYGAEVWGIDLADIGIATANKMAAANGVAERCRFMIGDATATDFPDDFFDYVVFTAALHHVVKYPGMREETWRVLRPGGALVFCDILRDNKFYNACKSIYLFFRPETDSGVNITMADFEEFWQGYEKKKIEHLSLLEGWKHFVPRAVAVSAPGRALLYLTSRIDDALLKLRPGWGRYCLEIAGALRKPASAAGEATGAATGTVRRHGTG